MDFTLSADQQALRDAARSMLAAECPPALVRTHMDDPSVADGLWRHLREWAGLGGAPLVDLCLFVEETGAVLAPGPFFASAAMFAPLLRAAGVGVADDAVGTVAVAGLDGRWVPNDESVRTFVPEVDRVDMVAIVGGGPRLALVERAALAAGGVRHVATLDASRRLFEVDVPSGVDWVPLSADAFADAMERAVVALSAEMLGTARWMFDATLAYAKERVQFDRPIGSFQAVQHKLADMRLALERAWSAVYYAAMAVDADDPDRHRAAHVAKAAAGEAVRRNAKDGIQIHGGIGYTWEHDLHLYIRRAYAQEAWLGTADDHRDALADLIL